MHRYLQRHHPQDHTCRRCKLSRRLPAGTSGNSTTGARQRRAAGFPWSASPWTRRDQFCMWRTNITTRFARSRRWERGMGGINHRRAEAINVPSHNSKLLQSFWPDQHHRSDRLFWRQRVTRRTIPLRNQFRPPRWASRWTARPNLFLCHRHLQRYHSQDHPDWNQPAVTTIAGIPGGEVSMEARMAISNGAAQFYLPPGTRRGQRYQSLRDRRGQ